jgi:hypothetical protein
MATPPHAIMRITITPASMKWAKVIREAGIKVE